MTALIFHVETLKVFARYSDEKTAKRTLANAQKRGWKLDGYRYSPSTLAKLIVGTPEEHIALDDEVEVKNLMSGNPVKLRRSELGGPCDPSTERYWSM